MNRFWRLLFFAFWIAAAAVLCRDAAQPERWADWRHDPRWFGPALAIIAILTGALLLRAWREEKGKR